MKSRVDYVLGDWKGLPFLFVGAFVLYALLVLAYWAKLGGWSNDDQILCNYNYKAEVVDLIIAKGVEKQAYQLKGIKPDLIPDALERRNTSMGQAKMACVRIILEYEKTGKWPYDIP